ncbi:MAG: aminotransferase, partial [Gammaproteobacteria bacterium]|nr:aminotransferase [Gammaproteobacteria bacterium]
PDELANIYQACVETGNEDRVLMFASTSKMSLAGSGVAAMAASPANIEDTLKHLAVQTIGPDKLNQLRHARFFGDIGGVRAHMRKHAELVKPKFDLVHEVLHEELDGKDIATWTNPNGGYFISLDVWDGCAKQVIQVAADVGVNLTKAGAPFPYGKDPRDCNIRIAPTFPRREEIKLATEVLAVCIQLVAVRQLLGKSNDSKDAT